MDFLKIAIALLGCLLVASTETWTQEFEIEENLELKLSNGDTVDYFIIFDERASLNEWTDEWTKVEKAEYVYDQLQKTAMQSQEKVIELLNQEAISFRPYYIFNGIYLRSDSSIVNKLRSFDEIEALLPNYDIRAMEVEGSKKRKRRQLEKNLPWGISYIRANLVWEMGITGEGAIVAGEDTGYDWDHDALIHKYRGLDSLGNVDHNYNWHDAIHEPHPINDVNEKRVCGFSNQEPCDDSNHGTHTMGTIVGSYDSLYIGVAPGAKWIASRNMDLGYGSIASYVESMEWFLAPTDLQGNNARPDLAPDVINNSWGCPEMEGCNVSNSYIVEEAIVNLKKSGVFVCVSAGNDGRGGCGTITTPPSSNASSFSVGAMKENGKIAFFSSRGNVQTDINASVKPDVVAPGYQVLSSIRGNSYSLSSGTSMAAPHVAGTVALMVSANPHLKGRVATLEEILRSTAHPVLDSSCSNSLTSPNPVYGYGVIDAYDAVVAAIDFGQNIPSDIDEISNESIDWYIYPNPARNSVLIRKSDSSKTRFAVYAMNGQLMSRFTSNATIYSMDISTMQAGSYVLVNEESGTNHQLIVQGK